MNILSIESNKKILIPQAILDLDAGQLLSDRAVVINYGRIEQILKKDDLERKDINPVSIISLDGLTILPGMIDCHVHLALDGWDFQQSIKRWETKNELREYLKDTMQTTLSRGIVAVRDGGDKQNIGLMSRQMLEENAVGPIVQASGFALRKDQYYGSFLGSGIKNNSEIKEQINLLSDLKVDQIKVLVSGIVSFKTYGKVGKIQFSQAELEQIVKYAHAKGLKVMAHASSDEAVKLAIQAGADTIEHGYFISNSSLKTMAQENIAWIPTIVPVAIQTESPWKKSFSSQELEVIGSTYNLQIDKVAIADDYGVRLGIGTDSGAGGVLHGNSFVRELELFKSAGLSNLKILQAAILNGAKITGLEDLGGLQPGKLACLIGVEGNPLENMEVLNDVKLTMMPSNISK